MGVAMRNWSGGKSWQFTTDYEAEGRGWSTSGTNSDCESVSTITTFEGRVPDLRLRPTLLNIRNSEYEI